MINPETGRNMDDLPSPSTKSNPFHKAVLTTLATLVGIAAGSYGMWRSIAAEARQDQAEFEARINKQVRKELEVDNRITRLEERYESLKSTVWQAQTSGAAVK